MTLTMNNVAVKPAPAKVSGPRRIIKPAPKLTQESVRSMLKTCLKNRRIVLEITR